jgi:5-methylcytosine-specific restriction endonuclease McrA
MRRRWAEQPEKMVESNNRSYAKHRDKRIATRRAYHASHRERAKEYQKGYREANRKELNVRALDSVARRRARLKGVHVERVSRLAVFERDEWLCWLCEEAVDPAALGGRRPSLDHVVPLYQGGEHSMANVKLAHLSCNQGRPKH